MTWRIFWLRTALLAPGVLVAALLTPGIRYSDGVALLIAVPLLCVLNSFLKPLLMLFSLPFILLTFGFGIILINALLLWIVAVIIPGFEVEGFLSALIGALIISATSLIVNLAVSGRGRKRMPGHFTVRTHRGNLSAGRPGGSPRGKPIRPPRKDDDVIDI